jgi:lactoylglutathione lyase
MIKALAHTCFLTRDLEKSIDFYTQVLDLKHGFDFRNDQGKRFGAYLFVGGRTFIELFEAAHEDTTKSSFQHICLEVEDIFEAVKAIRAAGVECTEAEMGGDGSWQAWLADPDGNRIELHHYTDKSMQNVMNDL